MTIEVNGIPVEFPTTLRDITLKQRIDFQKEHGNLLDDMQKQVLAIEDETERELDKVQLSFEKMYRTVAFFMNATVDAVKETQFIDTIANIYFTSANLLFEEERDLVHQTDFIWNDVEWTISPPLLKNGDKMTFGEMIDAKQMVQDMISLGKNKWECLLPLAAIFLRKKDEKYEESFLYEGSERLKLMESLPMDLALHVAFFLSSSVNIFISIFQYSSPPDQKVVAET